MHVVIKTAACPGDEVHISEFAMRAVRLGFNPSALGRVDRIKALAAALVTEFEAIRYDSALGGHDASVAITQAQAASMFGVAAATADLPG